MEHETLQYSDGRHTHLGVTVEIFLALGVRVDTLLLSVAGVLPQRALHSVLSS